MDARSVALMNVPLLLDALIETSQDAFIAIDAEGRITRWNARAADIFGWEAAMVVGQPMVDLIIPEAHRERHLQGMKHFHATGNSYVVNRRMTVQALRRTGETFPVEMTISIGQENGTLVFFSFLHDLSERQKTEDDLRQLARSDVLTQLPNRRHVQERLESAIAACQRSGRQLSILFIDLDHFKGINDLHGHAAGDAVLREVAVRLRGQVRQSDFVGRLAGDEFLVLMEDTVHEQNAVTVAQKLMDAIAAPIDISGGKRISVTASIGLSCYQAGDMTPETLIRQADTAMYQAKRSGRSALSMWQDMPAPAAGPAIPVRAPFLDFMEKILRPAPDRPSRESILQDALRATRAHFSMDVAFIGRFDRDQRIFQCVEPPINGVGIRQGAGDPLEDSFCQRVVDGRLPECMPDAFLNTEAVSLPVTRSLPVRAHLSVPLHRKDGSVYGTLCCFSHSADLSLNDRDANILRLLGSMLGNDLE
jgi:diguanylate cyclase (GGDEF)-like protein/PAS domain S-box-containing protein